VKIQPQRVVTPGKQTTNNNTARTMKSVTENQISPMIGKTSCAFKMLVGNPLGAQPLARSRRRLEDGNKMVHLATGCEIGR
jgi:hypothetical protein